MARQLADDVPKLEFGPEMVLVAIHRIPDCQGPGLERRRLGEQGREERQHRGHWRSASMCGGHCAICVLCSGAARYHPTLPENVCQTG